LCLLVLSLLAASVLLQCPTANWTWYKDNRELRLEGGCSTQLIALPAAVREVSVAL
jgi:hypothetical protein